MKKEIVISNNLANYINKNLILKNWEAIELSKVSGINPSDISKYRKGTVQKLKADIFYKIYKAFDDSCSSATKIIYPELDLKLNKYKPKKRNEFGHFMAQFEQNKNSIEEISAKTDINEQRLKELYYRNASVEAHELLLIEKAIGKKQGELFEEIYK